VARSATQGGGKVLKGEYKRVGGRNEKKEGKTGKQKKESQEKERKALWEDWGKEHREVDWKKKIGYLVSRYLKLALCGIKQEDRGTEGKNLVPCLRKTARENT